MDWALNRAVSGVASWMVLTMASRTLGSRLGLALGLTLGCVVSWTTTWGLSVGFASALASPQSEHRISLRPDRVSTMPTQAPRVPFRALVEAPSQPSGEILTDFLLHIQVTAQAGLFPPVHGQVWLEHQPNFDRTPDSEEVHQLIRYFIYRENGRENDRFDPARGDGVLVPRENLGGVVDTDLLKARFYPPRFDSSRDRDIYPVDFKFRASLARRLFKKAFVTAFRPLGERYWKVFYNDVLEVDGMAIHINVLGEVQRMQLFRDGRVIKQLSLNEIPTIPESEF